MSEGDRAFRRGLLPALLALALVWAIGAHNVSTLDFPHAVWRCGSTWQVLVNHNTPDLVHLDPDNHTDNFRDAVSECHNDARGELGWEIPAGLILAAWFVVWSRRWRRAEDRDSDAMRQARQDRRGQSETPPP